MKPVRTATSNMVYQGPTPEVSDLHCERVQLGTIRSVWWLTPVEREAIARGANIALTISTEPIPPVSLGLSFDDGVGEDSPDKLLRLHNLRLGLTEGGYEPGPG